jgi:DNA sulfur modification protein DndB
LTVLKKENLVDLLANVDAQKALRRTRRLPYVERSIRNSEYPPSLEDGWYELKKLKTVTKVAKNKEPDEILEDEIWSLFSEMGFKYLSKDRKLTISYDDQGGAKQQMDVLAVDDECAILVECKAADGKETKKGNFKETIEAIGGKKAGLIRELRTLFGKPKLKIGFVFVTRRYQITPADKERMDAFNIRHISERDIEYFHDLTAHLGESARFQFHADLFGGQDIPEIDNKVPAIQGKMGGHTYYSFSIEPAKLLKLGFVLHRTKSVRMTPSYQRLIKKGRLANIQAFVANGGFFPNSLLVSVDSGGKKLTFDRAKDQPENSITKLGMLHLPPRYRSLYVIDGQHRLYAYSGSPYAETNAIPVVAFVDLDRADQLRLFMDINENQKAVSKNLKNTLDADLKWNSENLKERADGIRKQLALDLGDDIHSPLFGRVQVGEDEKTDTRTITLEAILKGVQRSKFVGKYTKSAIVQHGYFYVGSSEKTLERLKDFIFHCLQYSQDRLPDEWQRRATDGALLSVNAGITAYIWLISDVLQHLKETGKVDPLTDSASVLLSEMTYYLDGFVEYMKGLTFDERLNLKSKYGSGADTRLWRCLQKGIADYRPDFAPEGLEEYWINQSRQYNLETYEKIGDLEFLLRDEVKEALEKAHGSAWLKKGIPGPLFEKLHADAAKKNREIEHVEDEKTPWDCMYIINYRDVMSYGANWSVIFQKRFTIPGQEKLKKDDRTGWLVKLNKIRNQNSHEHSVTENEYEFVRAVHEWLVNGNDGPVRQIAVEMEADAQ